MEARSRHRLSQDDLHALLAVTRHLAAPFDLDIMLTEVTQAACRILRAERSSVWLLDASGGTLVLEVAADLPQLRIAIDRGLVGACARERCLVNVPDCYADRRFDAAIDRASGYLTRCCLAFPLIDHRDVLVGVLQVLNKRTGSFDAGDEVLGEALAAQCAVAVSRARLHQEALTAQRLRQELDLARIVQDSTLPKRFPRPHGYAMHAIVLPAEQTGGDTYDLSALDGQVLIVLADAAGHGIGPALSVTQMHAMLRMAFRMGGGLRTAFVQVNNLLAEILPDGHFVTAFIGLLDPVAHTLRFISGGQAPILHFVAAQGHFVRYNATSFPMGAMPMTHEPAPVESPFGPGDILVLLSDGIYEYADGAGERFGCSRVERLIEDQRDAGPEQLGARLLEAVQAFAGPARQDDDVTIVLVKRDST